MQFSSEIPDSHFVFDCNEVKYLKSYSKNLFSAGVLKKSDQKL